MAKKQKEEEYRVRRVLRNKDGSPIRAPKKVHRNEPCHCGSNKKYKACCFQRDQASMGISKEEREAAIKKMQEKENKK